MGELMSKCFIDPSSLPHGFGGFAQVSFLGLAYGAILFNASNMIAEGSELLLLVPSLAGIVGPIVLPILGAVPDGAIVLFSGLGPNAQQELAVGVGALAGSTIMLLTVPWCMSIIGGRVDIKDGTAQYRRPRDAPADWKKLTPGSWNLNSTGVSGSSYVSTNGIILIVTSLSYLVIQIPAFYASYSGATESESRNLEGNFAGLGMVACLAVFAWYLYYQWQKAGKGQDKNLDWRNAHVRIKAIKDMNLSLRAVLVELRNIREVRDLAQPTAKSRIQVNAQPLSHDTSDTGEVENVPPRLANQPLLEHWVVPDKCRQLLKDVLRPFFEALDIDKNGLLDFSEVKQAFHGLNEFPTEEELHAIFRNFDVDKSSFLDFEEFIDTMIAYLFHEKSTFSDTKSIVTCHSFASEASEEEEIPEEFAHLPPEKQQAYIKQRAFTMMLIGTALILVFSDPMVGVFSELGRRTNISSFYISFVLAPLASNASELFASYSYSLKKTQKSIEISFSALQGAGCMNNSFCLAVFLGIIYFRRLVWKYSAETIAIILVEVAIALFSQKKVMTLFQGLLALSMFPLSIGCVAFLNKFMGME